MSSATVLTVLAFVMPAAAVLTALAFVMFSMMTAQDIRIKAKAAAQQRRHGLIRVAGYAAIEGNPGFLQSPARAAADPAADQRIHMDLFQNIRQSAVPAAVGADDRGERHLTVFHVIDLEALRMPEVLKNLSVLISYRDSHL